MKPVTQNEKSKSNLEKLAAFGGVFLVPVFCVQTYFTVPADKVVLSILFILIWLIGLGLFFIKKTTTLSLNIILMLVIGTIVFGMLIVTDFPSIFDILFPTKDYYISFDVFFDNNGTGSHGKIYDPVKNTKITIFFLDKYKGIYIKKTNDDGSAIFNLPRSGPIRVEVCGLRLPQTLGTENSSPGRTDPVQLPVPIKMHEECENT